MARTVLIVDDDPVQRRLYSEIIASMGFRALTADDGEGALDLLLDINNADKPDAVLLDLNMPGVDGMTVMERVVPVQPDLPIVVLTGHGGVDIAVKAMRAGAGDFLVKPVSPERLKVTLDNSMKLTSLRGEVSRLQRQADGEIRSDDIVGTSDALRATIDLSMRAAQSQIPVLIEGESGVGKELIARFVQSNGPRAGKPFVTVNCGAIPDNLIESLLFGHEKGSFTGATGKHIGKFEEASGGTLFLDEIGELKADMQVKLLRALQEGTIDPVGSRKTVQVDVRFVAATNRDLFQMVQEGTFREDLYYRINVFPLHVPPLRERRQDIPELVNHFVTRFAALERKQVASVDPKAMDMLLGYPWPGNVRQLENAVFRAVVLCDGPQLSTTDFPHIARAQGVPLEGLIGAGTRAAPAPANNGHANGGLPILGGDGEVRALSDVEADVIRYALTHYRGQMSRVARRLGISRSTLYRKVRDLGIEGIEGEA
ncbi:MAG: sigma-54 dependent transcriptional regulator [Proteobacteria bacterium]|nr:sigma-54 dependent transcriptional regulator [Pseudomonadota bacterium]